MSFTKMILIIISMVLVNNYPLAQFLGICPFLGVSKDLDSAKGMATVGGVAIDGANKTVSGLSNTTWEVAKATQDVSVGGYKGSTKVATESQLAAAISEAQLRLLS